MTVADALTRTARVASAVGIECRKIEPRHMEVRARARCRRVDAAYTKRDRRRSLAMLSGSDRADVHAEAMISLVPLY